MSLYEEDVLVELRRELARYRNPWTVEIRAVHGHWLEFAHDGPLTLADAEARVKDYRQESPDATFRVAPWFNLDQRAEREQLRVAKERLDWLTRHVVSLGSQPGGMLEYRFHREYKSSPQWGELFLQEIDAAIQREAEISRGAEASVQRETKEHPV